MLITYHYIPTSIDYFVVGKYISNLNLVTLHVELTEGYHL